RLQGGSVHAFRAAFLISIKRGPMLKSRAMPLPVSEVERELTHIRRVRYEGYKRNDGLFDIEAHLSDTKNHDYTLKTGVRRAGQPIHDMWLRITIDRSFTI